MSHDTDKLIRQLSLVAFLMAERRPLTARDVKGNVEGYSEMSDEAFARRYYSDRAELISLGVPLHSQRDEFTGEELYTLRSENYFLEKLELDDEELAALQTALYLLEGTFAYAEPLRLALQNLALGRPGFDNAPTDTAASVQVRDPDYSPELAGRLSKLEAAISKQRTVKFSYWSPRPDRVAERTLNPYALRRDRGTWYVVGLDLDRDAIRTFRISRIRSDIRFATRRERDFRLPEDFDVDAHRVGEDWQHGPIGGDGADRGRRRHGVVGAPHPRRCRRPDGRRLRDALRRRRAARGLGAAPERACRAARARGAARRLRARPGARPRGPRRRAAVARARAQGRRRRSHARIGRRRPSCPSASPSSRRSSRICSPPAATAATRRSPPPSSPSASPSHPTSSRSTSRCSISSTSAAAATPSTRSSTATRCAWTRSCTATSSARRRG